MSGIPLRSSSIALLLLASLPANAGPPSNSLKQLHQSAIATHTRCNLLRKQLPTLSKQRKKRQRSLIIKTCSKAAVLYQRWLQRAPQKTQQEHRYTITWYRADVLYFSKEYNAAAKGFKKVRDWPGQRAFHHEAAYSLIDTLTHEVRLACQRGLIQKACEPQQAPQKAKAPTTKPTKPSPHTKQPIPALQSQLVQARLYYLQQLTHKSTSKRRPAQIYLLAKIFFAYKHMKKSRRWFWRFVKQYPKHHFARPAAESIVSSLMVEKKLDAAARANERLLRMGLLRQIGCLPSPQWTLAAQRAEAKGQHQKAARLYIAGVTKNPKFAQAPAALWNAALLFLKAKQPRAAARQFQRILREYPTWKLAKHTRTQLRALQAKKPTTRPTSRPKRRR